MAPAPLSIRLPFSLRRLAGGATTISDSAATVSELLGRLDERFPGFAARVCEPDGDIKRHMRIFVNGRDVRDLEGLATRLSAGDDVVIAAAMAGG